MAAVADQRPAKEPTFQVGDRVRFLLGTQQVEATVTEDRGRIGVGGRRLYRVEMNTDPDSVLDFEMPAVELEKVE